MLTTLVSTLAISAAAGAQDTQAEPPEAGDQSVAALTELICAADDETRWLNIPWRVSFWQGVLDSQRQRKPILLWAMNGHPLGCT